jgi:ATP:corrinoid adenosyltransferase
MSFWASAAHGAASSMVRRPAPARQTTRSLSATRSTWTKCIITSLKPRSVTFDQDNHIRDRLSYSVDLDAQGRYSFSILDEANATLAILALASGT